MAAWALLGIAFSLPSRACGHPWRENEAGMALFPSPSYNTSPKVGAANLTLIGIILVEP